MCCSGKCPWEVNDWQNGGTICRKPGYMVCWMDSEEEEFDEEADDE